MKTKHQLIFSDSRNMKQIKNNSVDLIVTSPPYPMIKMWDKIYETQNPKINQALSQKEGDRAYHLMHLELNKTWKECHRVLKKGGIACINIGDATRTIGGQFQLYSNHSLIVQQFKKLGFDTLPMILWHKKTNAPNKFMGSGMLPAGAYITLEHEYILIFRKGPKRIFKTKEDINRRQRSAFFWEERNKWFSDIWFDMPGTSQNLNQKNLRKRNGAFPFALAYRLICMYSLQSDTVLDPFAGTGTTTLASMATGRNSLSFEIDNSFKPYIIDRLITSKDFLNNKITQRLLEHIRYAKDYSLKKGKMKYTNKHYGFPVMTKQETNLQFPFINQTGFEQGVTSKASPALKEEMKHENPSKINEQAINQPKKCLISAEHVFIKLPSAMTKDTNAKKVKNTKDSYKQLTIGI